MAPADGSILVTKIGSFHKSIGIQVSMLRKSQHDEILDIILFYFFCKMLEN